MPSDRIVSVPNKPHISNYGSQLAHIVKGPGLNELQCASGRLASGHKPHARVAVLKGNGELAEAKLVKCEWHPHVILAEFEFPTGLKVSQRSWVDGSFAHSSLTFKGDLPAGDKIAADGVSYMQAKALVSPQGSVMLEEMDPSYKPLALEIASSVSPSRVLLSTDGKAWKESDFIWGDEVHYRMVFDHLPGEVTFSAHLNKLSEWVGSEAWNDSWQSESDVKREWIKAFNEELPDIHCPDNRYRDLLQFCFYVHRSSVITAGGMLPYPFVVPSKMTYPMWWMWDTAFQSIVDFWIDKPLAVGTLLNHTVIQSRKGCIPDAAGAFCGDTGDLKWVHPEKYDDFPPPCTGPCVTGIAAMDLYQRTGNLDMVKKLYPHLVIYERWLMQEKNSKLDPDLLAFYYWTDVGWDDSKRWGKSGMGGEEVGWDLPVIPVDGNVFLAILRDTLSAFAGLLGESERKAEYAAKAARTRRAIDRLMWNEEEGFYFDLLPNGKMLDVWTPAGLTPMLAGMPSVETYHRLREHLLDSKKFWTKYPLPTLAIDDPDCSYEDNWWRGGTWPVINWQIAEGLFKYDPELGLRLIQSTVEMMTRDGYPTCTEYYNPVKGDAKGAIDQGWGAMVADMILRRVYGLHPSANGLELKPNLPADWPEATVRNVFVDGTNVEVRYVRSAVGLKAEVRNHGPKEIAVTSGQNRQLLPPDGKATITIG